MYIRPKNDCRSRNVWVMTLLQFLVFLCMLYVHVLSMLLLAILHVILLYAYMFLLFLSSFKQMIYLIV